MGNINNYSNKILFFNRQNGMFNWVNSPLKYHYFFKEIFAKQLHYDTPKIEEKLVKNTNMYIKIGMILEKIFHTIVRHFMNTF